MVLQETLLHLHESTVMDIMGTALAQGIKAMISMQEAVVHCSSKVAGGTVNATPQTSMVSTMVDHTHPSLMV